MIDSYEEYGRTTIPINVLPYDDGAFRKVAEYLTDEDEYVTELTMHVTAEEEIVVENVATMPAYPDS